MAISRTVCVDLDGVLAVYDGWKGVKTIGKPIRGAKAFMEWLKSQKVKIVIFTTRCSKEFNDGRDIEFLKLQVEKWLKVWKIPYDEIYTGQGKPLAAAYVDDRGISCIPQKKLASYHLTKISIAALLREEG
jgi:hypothetical protein